MSASMGTRGDAVGADDGEESAGSMGVPGVGSISCVTRAVNYPFLPGMASCFADYLGMAMLTPALPYFLSDIGMSAAAVATWTGAITTAQYAGAACGNMAVGAMGDALGSRATLGATLFGDVALFTATAFSKNVTTLIVVRCLAGVSSPLVASLHYILRRATSKKHTLEGVNAYSISVNAGYAFGSVIVGLGYDALGWTGLNVLSAVVAGFALAAVLALVKEEDEGKMKRSPSVRGAPGESPRDAARGGADDEKEKPFSVYRTGAMVSHMVTAVNVGYQFMGFLVLFVLMAKQILGWSATALGWSFIAIPIVNVLGFMTGSRYLPDRRDLNRSFPGSARGSLAGRIAHLVMTEVVAKCSVGIDLDTGSDRRTNLPQIRTDLEDPETRRLAEAFAGYLGEPRNRSEHGRGE